MNQYIITEEQIRRYRLDRKALCPYEKDCARSTFATCMYCDAKFKSEQSIRQDERGKVLDEVIETWREWHHAGYERPIQRETVVKVFEKLRKQEQP